MSDEQKNGIFSKLLKAGHKTIDNYISQAENLHKAKIREESDFNFGKAVTKNRSHYVGSQGFHEKPGAVGYEFHRQMAVKSSVVSAIIKTRQNRAAAYAQLANDSGSKGFKITLKDPEAALEKLRKEMFPEDVEKESKGPNSLENNQSRESSLDSDMKEISKAEELGGEDLNALNNIEAPEEGKALSEQDKEKILKIEMEKRTAKKRQAIANFIINCGELQDRPFESKKWTFNSYLRAILWDSLVYDQIATEFVPKEAQVVNGKYNLAYFQPVDAATIRYSSDALKKYRDHDLMTNQDILYPEEELKALEEKHALELDDEKLDANAYKYVQVVKGRIQRAFTEDEMCLAMRNPVTDIYMNGYSLSELEILVALVSSHLHTEYYNRAYFINGFSAKGILHIKKTLNRAKLEELRRNWNHMLKGNRNSFQTPIFAGMDEVQWIPLTQNHSEMEFSLWMNYLIKMICAIYQIDPSEIGYGMKDEGGAGMSGDNTQEKLINSKDKGFLPLMNFLAEFMTKQVVEKLDPDYKFEWVGLIEEDPRQLLERQAQEVKFMKSVNEIRDENGLPPIEGADHWILDPVYQQFYMAMHPEAQSAQMQSQMQEQVFREPEQTPEDKAIMDEDAKQADHERAKDMESHKAKLTETGEIKKSFPLKVEYYKLED